MEKVININEKSSLVGIWKSCDSFDDIHVTIYLEDGVFKVAIEDTSDDESPEIYEVVYDSDQYTLSFNAYWGQSGRFVKYRFQSEPKENRVSVTYTFTDTEIWEKSET